MVICARRTGASTMPDGGTRIPKGQRPNSMLYRVTPMDQLRIGREVTGYGDRV